MAMGIYGIRFVMSVQDRTRGSMQRLQRDVTNLQRANNGLAKSYAAMDIGRSTQMRGLLGTAALGYAAKVAADFETSVTKAATQVQGNNNIIADSGKLQKAILDQMQLFPASAQDMASAAYDIFGTMNVPLEKGVGLLKLFNMVAVAGGTDIGTATNTMITLANNFGSSFGQMANSTETAFRIIRFGRLEFDEFSQMMNQVVPAAARTGQSLKDVGGAMAFLTERIPSQPQVATSIGRLLDIFNRPDFKRGAKIMGLNIETATGELRALPKIIEELSRLDLAKPGQIDALIPVVTSKGRGGGQGITSNIQARKALGLLVLESKEYLKVQDLILARGHEFERRYVAMYGSAGVQWARMKAQLQAFLIMVGQYAIPTFKLLMEKMAQFIYWAREHKTLLKWITVLSTFFFVGGLVVGTLTSLIAAWTTLAIVVTGTAIPALMRGLGFLGAGTAAASATGVAAIGRYSASLGLLSQSLLMLTKAVWPIAVAMTIYTTFGGKGGLSETGVGKAWNKGWAWIDDNLIPGKRFLSPAKDDVYWKDINKKKKEAANSGIAEYEQLMKDIEKQLKSIGKDSDSKFFADQMKKMKQDTKALDAEIAKQLGLGESGPAAQAKQTAAQITQQTKSILDQASQGLEQLYEQYNQKNNAAFGSLFAGPTSQSGAVQWRKQFGIQMNTREIIADLKGQIGQFTKYRNDLALLRKKGLNETMLDQIKEMGAEGIPYVNELIHATPGQVRQLNKLTKGKESVIAKATRIDFDAEVARWNSFGQKTALAIAAGMESQTPALAAAMDKMVKTMWGSAAAAMAAAEVAAQNAANGTVAPGAGGTFTVAPKVTSISAATYAANQKAHNWDTGNPNLRARGNGGMTAPFQPGVERYNTQIFNINGTFLTEEQMFANALRAAAFNDKNRRR